MLQKIDVSIIIPVYNVEAYIEECLHSVMDQHTDASVECIIVDDCGTDRSLQIAMNVIESYNGPITFQLIQRSQNGGLSAARNSGIRVAKGEYIYLLDSDDYLPQDAIQNLVEAAEKYPEAQIVCGDFTTKPYTPAVMSVSMQGKDFPEFSNDVKWIRSVFLSKFPVIACNKLIKRDFILSNNLFFKEGILHEDNHWHALAYPYVTSLAFVDKVTYIYRIREGSITMSANANVRKLTNLAIIYNEMFARRFRWDRPWIDWTFNCLNELKFAEKFNYPRTESKKIFRHLITVLLNNPSISIGLKTLFAYYSLPRPLMRGKLITATLNRMYK